MGAQFSRWCVALSVLISVWAVSAWGLETEFRNNTSYPMQVSIEMVQSDTNIHVITDTMNPGEGIQFNGTTGENYRPLMEQILHDGQWVDKNYGNGTGFGIEKWGKFRPKRQYNENKIDFAAGTTLTVSGSWADNEGYHGIWTENSPGDYEITTWTEQVTITVENDTAGDIEIRPVDTSGSIIGPSPGWITVAAAMSQNGTHDSPWHFEITNDGGTTTWDTPEPGVDSTYVVSGDGSGGLQLGEGSGGDYALETTLQQATWQLGEILGAVQDNLYDMEDDTHWIRVHALDIYDRQGLMKDTQEQIELNLEGPDGQSVGVLMAEIHNELVGDGTQEPPVDAFPATDSEIASEAQATETMAQNQDIPDMGTTPAGGMPGEYGDAQSGISDIDQKDAEMQASVDDVKMSGESWLAGRINAWTGIFTGLGSVGTIDSFTLNYGLPMGDEVHDGSFTFSFDQATWEFFRAGELLFMLFGCAWIFFKLTIWGFGG